MEYKDLRKLYHISSEMAATAYAERIESEDAIRIPIQIGKYDAFCLVNPEIYRLILKSERLNKEIDSLVRSLPGKAIEQYSLNCLIDEIVLTNDIEGVNSSRREIGKVLERLERNDRRGRFRGITEKYLALFSDEQIEISTCADIRKLYDDLVLEEVIEKNPDNAPDGEVFRLSGVTVYDAAQKPIHHGIEPESAIVDVMTKALDLLTDQEIEALVRIAVFHFLFEYVHPFYDGNGRMGRFLSSYVLSHELSPLVSLRLSYSIKDNISKYYKAFSLCEHPLNRGDLTPFVITFSELVIEAMEGMRESLADKKAEMLSANKQVKIIPGIESGRDGIANSRLGLGRLLVQAALFAEDGISVQELSEVMGLSNPTVYKRLDFFQTQGLLLKRQVGHRVFYAMDLERLGQVGN